MSVTQLVYPLSTSTWFTFAMMMPTVQTPKDPTTAHVIRDTLEKGFPVKVNKN